MTRFRLLTSLIAINLGIAMPQSLIGPAGAAAAPQSSLEGRVRVVVNSGDVQATITEIIGLANEAGWTRFEITKPNMVTLIPPHGYAPETFGKLLDTLSKSKHRNWGLQLLDTSGRAISPDGNPVS